MIGVLWIGEGLQLEGWGLVIEWAGAVEAQKNAGR